MTRVAFCGYGSLGRALAGLALQAGFEVRAWDPHSRPEEAVAAPSPDELVAGAAYVIVAVPAPALRGALESLRPHLTSEQLVLDVCSVKRRPMDVLAAVLGQEVPWAGTHPLFGPTSLSLGERPRQVVVCPHPMHPDAAARARGLFEQLDCQVVELDADAHDRLMADTHALALFIGRALLEVEGAEEKALVPPSFRALARLMSSSRAEAPHLFESVQRDNPYAGAARRRLIDALVALDRSLSAEPPDEH